MRISYMYSDVRIGRGIGCRGTGAASDWESAATEGEEAPQDLHKVGQDLWSNLFYQIWIQHCHCPQQQ